MNDTITIISTKLISENGLFAPEKIKKINEDNDSEINRVFGALFNDNCNWADELDNNDQLLNIIECVRPLYSDWENKDTDNIKHELMNNEAIRKRILEEEKVMKELFKHEEFCNIYYRQQVPLYQVKGANVYGIEALSSTNVQDATTWINALSKVALLLCKNESNSINVNLFLHDKDVIDGKYYKPFYKVENPKISFNVSEARINELTVIFYQHIEHSNPIYNLICNPPKEDKKLQESIDQAKVGFCAVEEMIAVSKIIMSNSSE